MKNARLNHLVQPRAYFVWMGVYHKVGATLHFFIRPDISDRKHRIRSAMNVGDVGEVVVTIP